MAKQLHVIHRHTSDHLNPYTGSTESAYSATSDLAKLVLGEIAVQHNAEDPAIWIKVGSTSASTKYVKFTPTEVNVDSVGAGTDELTGDVKFATGVTATTDQVTEGVNFAVVSGEMTGNIILDKNLSTGSTHAVVNSAVTTAINELQDSAHTHDNKAVLDGITSTKVSNWDDAYTYRVTGATGDSYVSASVASNKVTVGATTALTEAIGKAHEHDNKTVLDGISSGDVANWDSAYNNMLTGITEGTEGTFVDVTVSTKANKSQSIGVSVTTAATSAATSSADGLATAYETKQYIDSKSGNIKNVTTIDGQSVGSSADTFNIATGNSLVTKSTVKSGSVITTTIGITTGATSGSSAGLAVNTDVKDYVDKAVTAATINGDGIVIGASGLSVSHKAYTAPSSTTAATLAHGGSFTGITAIAEDGYGHVTGATATTFTMPSETQLSTATTGSGNVVTGISVNNHQITKQMGYAVTSASGDDYISASTNNGALSVSLKSVADSKEDIAGASTTGSVADAKAVKDYVEEQITSSVQYCGATASLPASSGVGDLYIASAQIAVPAASSASGSATTAETGDYLICREAGKWDVIEKNLTGAVTSNTGLTSGALVAGNGNQTVKVAAAAGDSTHGIYIDASGKPVTTNAIQAVAASGTTSSASALTWNTEAVLGNVNVDGTDNVIKVKLPANPNTDTGTTLDGHYTPASSTTKSASTNYAIAGLQMDAKGHVTGVVDSAHKVETDVPSGAVFTDTKVTAVGNHYAPACSTTIDATSKYLVAGLEVDAKGHVTGVKDSTYKLEADVPSGAVFTDTHVTEVANHYTPTSSTTKSASTNYAIAGLRMDAAGHVTGVVNSAHKVETDVPSGAVFTDSACTVDGHYTPSSSASTAGTSSSFIQQVVLDDKKHVVGVVTGNPASAAVVDCASTITTASTTLGTIDGTAITAKIGVTDIDAAITTAATNIATIGGKNITAKVNVSNSAATIPMSASTATTLATVAGQDITAKVAMNSLTIAGANGLSDGITFDGKSDIEILTLDCGEY